MQILYFLFFSATVNGCCCFIDKRQIEDYYSLTYVLYSHHSARPVLVFKMHWRHLPHSLLIPRWYYHFRFTCNGDIFNSIPQSRFPHWKSIEPTYRFSWRVVTASVHPQPSCRRVICRKGRQSSVKEFLFLGTDPNRDGSIKIRASRELLFGLMTNPHPIHPIRFSASLIVCPWKLTKTIADTQSLSSPNNYSSC